MRDAQGKFLPGPDPDRHRLTKVERRRGYYAALYKSEDIRHFAWVWRKVRGWYRARARARAGRNRGKVHLPL